MVGERPSPPRLFLRLVDVLYLVFYWWEILRIYPQILRMHPQNLRMYPQNLRMYPHGFRPRLVRPIALQPAVMPQRFVDRGHVKVAGA